MDDQLHSDDEFTSSETTNATGSACYTGGIFSGSQHFTVAGGTFTSITKNYNTAPTVPSDFRMIPLGDIDLQHEIRVDNHAGIVNRHSKRARVRVYSAKLNGQTSNMTVAMYLGNGAEEEWKQDIARYMSIRHPNIIQIFAAASSRHIHATVFHGGTILNLELYLDLNIEHLDLIMFQHFLDLYRHSPILNVYIYACAHTEFKETHDYFLSDFQHPLSPYECTFWIRRSTGRLCADLIPNNNSLLPYMSISSPQAIHFLDAPTQDRAIEFLTLDNYHRICWLDISQSREFYCGSACTPLKLGAIISCSSENRFEDSVEIALLQDARASIHGPLWPVNTREMMEDGWIRYNSDEISDTTFSFDIFLSGTLWLSQANHIFNRLQITSNFENYVFVEYIVFKIIIPATTANIPKGFLFLCPETHFQAGPSSFTWPNCPAYWSLDASGTERLSMDEAMRLGFPAPKLSTKIWGRSWDASVYAGLRQFHRAKGFNPDSQDVARHLGHPLYQLVSEVDAPFAHVDDEDICAAEEDGSLVKTDEESKNSATENKAESPVHDSAAADGEAEPSRLDDEIQPSSRISRLVMNVQMALMVFLTLSWLYNYVMHEK
ncbi:hypothetical protein B0H19DRAFT_1111916 [Mycena capillaripes]|nr:hypothetical protein B0H19DRAFT_1111916 [Mycena capillaripes]